MPTLLQDNFPEADGTNLSGKALQVGGTWWTDGNLLWTVQGGRASNGENNGATAKAVANAGATDGVITVDFRFDGTAGWWNLAGVLTRFVDKWTGEWRATADLANSLLKITDPSGATVASTAWSGSLATTYTLTVTVSGTSITAAIGGTSVTYATMGSNLAATQFGVWAWGNLARFDNFLMTSGGGGGTTISGAGRAVSLSIARGVGKASKSSAGLVYALSVPTAPGRSIRAAPGRTIDLSLVYGSSQTSSTASRAGLASALSIALARAAATSAAPGRTHGLSIVRAPGAVVLPAPGRTVALSVPRGVAAMTKAGRGSSTILATARALAATLAATPGRIVCLTIARGSTTAGTTIEARAGASVTLSIVHATYSPLPGWKRIRIGVTPMKARAAFRLEVFDFEDIEIFGTIKTLSTLAGAKLEFIGWNEDGRLAWDSSVGSATVDVTDAVNRTYASTTPAKPAGKYKWQIRITNQGQKTVPVWGYLTVTQSNSPIPKGDRCA